MKDEKLKKILRKIKDCFYMMLFAMEFKNNPYREQFKKDFSELSDLLLEMPTTKEKKCIFTKIISESQRRRIKIQKQGERRKK